jgi:hypothetical protein
LSEQTTTKKDDDFQDVWFSRSVAPADGAKKLSPVQKSIEEIKQYAYDAFDKLDTNKNGFIENDELVAALNDANTPMREKSFITFLLTNQEEIAASCKEGTGSDAHGISRLDIEFYFRLVISKLG